MMKAETTTQSGGSLLYMGQASIRITTPEGKVIYIDPYAGSEEDYTPAADLILITHSHFDHNAVELVTHRNPECEIITQREAIKNGIHQIFTFDYATVEAVEAGYNAMHSVRNCVGYVITLSDGVKLYFSGDTSKTEQMEEMADMEIDYAFLCTDGYYNMGPEEAAECAELIGAKHNIPYHNDTSNRGKMFDLEQAQSFGAPNLIVIDSGEEIELIK